MDPNVGLAAIRNRIVWMRELIDADRPAEALADEDLLAVEVESLDLWIQRGGGFLPAEWQK